MADVVDYPEFFATFPNAKDIGVKVVDNKSKDVVMGITPTGITLFINLAYYKNEETENNKAKKTIAHELQHHIHGTADSSNPAKIGRAEKIAFRDELQSMQDARRSALLDQTLSEVDKKTIRQKINNIQNAIDYLNGDENVPSVVKKAVNHSLDLKYYYPSLPEREARLAETDYAKSPYQSYNQDADTLGIAPKDFEAETKALRNDPNFHAVDKFGNPYDGDVYSQQLKKQADDIRAGKTSYERFNEQEQAGLRRGGSTHVEASLIVGRSEGANQDEKADRQEEGVEAYAKEVGLWHENTDDLLSEIDGEELDSGNESLVFYNPQTGIVTKSSNISQYRDLEDALDSITLHNTYFPEAAIEVVGFGLDADGEFQIITEQPFIQGTHDVSQEQIDAAMKEYGFVSSTKYPIPGRYKSDDALLNDLTPKNVILTPEGNIIPIDTIMHLNAPVWGEEGKREVYDNTKNEQDETPMFHSKDFLSAEKQQPINTKK